MPRAFRVPHARQALFFRGLALSLSHAACRFHLIDACPRDGGERNRDGGHDPGVGRPHYRRLANCCGDAGIRSW